MATKAYTMPYIFFFTKKIIIELLHRWPNSTISLWWLSINHGVVEFKVSPRTTNNVGVTKDVFLYNIFLVPELSKYFLRVVTGVFW